MTSFKVDDRFHGHPKVLNLSLAARGLWVTMGSWCAKHKTYGFVPHAAVRFLGGSKRQARELVDAGLLEVKDGGYQFHEWRKHQDGDYRRNIPKRIRQAVMERDGFKCQFCGSRSNLSLDHIIPYRCNGPDTVENLRVLCMPCNNKRFQNERRGASALV